MSGSRFGITFMIQEDWRDAEEGERPRYRRRHRGSGRIRPGNNSSEPQTHRAQLRLTSAQTCYAVGTMLANTVSIAATINSLVNPKKSNRQLF